MKCLDLATSQNTYYKGKYRFLSKKGWGMGDGDGSDTPIDNERK